MAEVPPCLAVESVKCYQDPHFLMHAVSSEFILNLNGLETRGDVSHGAYGAAVQDSGLGRPSNIHGYPPPTVAERKNLLLCNLGRPERDTGGGFQVSS